MRIARDNVTTLPNTVALYVPTTINGNQPAGSNQVLEILNYVMGQMIDLYGGCTMTDAYGGFKLASGIVVTERIHIVRSCATTINEEALIDLACEVARRMTQESVAIEFNGELSLVSLPTAAAA